MQICEQNPFKPDFDKALKLFQVKTSVYLSSAASVVLQKYKQQNVLHMAFAQKEAAAAVALLLCSWVPGALESQEMARRSLFPKHDQKQSQQLQNYL